MVKSKMPISTIHTPKNSPAPALAMTPTSRISTPKSCSSFVQSGVFAAVVIKELPSLEQAEAPGLSFDTKQDALNYAAEVAQEGSSWRGQVERPNIVEAYKQGQIELLCELSGPLALPPDWHISIRPTVVHLVEHRVDHQTSAAGKLDVDLRNMQFGSKQRLMLLEASKLVESPQGDIPSSIWLKRGNEIKYLFGDVLRPAFSLPIEVGKVFSEGKVSVLSSRSRRNSDRVASVVEGIAQVHKSITSEPGDSIWQWLHEPQEAQFVSWIKRIVLNDDGVWLTLSEAAGEHINFFNVRLGVLD
jgi:hypothetical protein